MERSKGDLGWAEREQALRAWLAGRENDTRRGETIPAATRLRANATLWGWMPLAVVIFWTAYILTRSIEFHDNGHSPVPKYDLSAYGGRDVVATTAEFFENTDGLHMRLYIPKGVNKVRVEDVAGDGSCSGAGSVPRYVPAGSRKHAEYGPARSRYGEYIMYGKRAAATTLTCRLNWRPLHDSYATYRIRIRNRGPRAPAAQFRLPINFGAPEMEGIRLFAIAGSTVRVDERTLVDGDELDATWKGIGAEQNRDILLIVIGALIALGAALVVEALRGEIELAIANDSAAGPEEAGR